MQDENSLQFESVGQAIAWLNAHNPARQKYYYNLEREARGDLPYDEQDNHAALLLTVQRVKKHHPTLHQIAWELWFRTPKDERIHFDDLARYMGRSARTVRRWLDKIQDDLEDDLWRQGFLTKRRNRKYD